ncbi:MAG TPA: HIT domain-containing protein [Patescibacteria group bacterium]|nr:HIT domain-containing protein [Patescibacteria group bacterium]
MTGCIFCKIRDREIPKEFIYEDESVMVFPDISPIRPVHLLIIPKEHIPTIMELENSQLMDAVHGLIKKMVQQYDLNEKGFRIVINGGGAQAIDHLHFHLTGPWGAAADL